MHNQISEFFTQNEAVNATLERIPDVLTDLLARKGSDPIEEADPPEKDEAREEEGLIPEPSRTP